MKKTLLSLFLIVVVVLLGVEVNYRVFSTDLFTTGCYVVSDSQILKVSALTRVMPTLSKFFPFWDKPIGIVVSDYYSGAVLKKFLVDENSNGIPYRVRFLDSERVLINTDIWRNAEYTHDLLVVNFHTGEFKAYKGLGSGDDSRMSAVSLDGKRMLRPTGGEMVDLTTLATVYRSTSPGIVGPEFSPDGNNYVCQESQFSKYLTNNRNEELLVGEWATPNILRIAVGGKNAYISDYHWSPSGKYIAALTNPGLKLQVWSKEGKLISQNPVKSLSWSFSWYPNDDGIAVFYDTALDKSRLPPTGTPHNHTAMEKITAKALGILR